MEIYQQLPIRSKHCQWKTTALVIQEDVLFRVDLRDRTKMGCTLKRIVGRPGPSIRFSSGENLTRSPSLNGHGSCMFM